MHKFSSLRLPGGVLQLSIGIALVISILCSSIILLAYYTRLTTKRSELLSILRDNTVSGIQYGMAHREDMPFHTIQNVDLFGEGIDSVRIVRRPWGVFEYLGVDAHRGRFHDMTFALIGALPDTLGKAAIFLPGDNGQLSLAGKTRIEGNVYLPGKGLAMGFLDGKWYEGKQLIKEGKILKSGKLMPELDTAALKDFAGVAEWTGHRTLPDLRRKHYPFHMDSVFVFQYAGELVIDDSLSGNVVVKSDQRIIIRSTARIENAIFMAPEIRVDDEFIGSLQLMATRLIVVGKKCKLNYPSSLSLVGHKRDSLISVGDSSKVEGIVVLPGLDRTTSSAGKLRIHKTAVVTGFVYVNGNTNLEGALWGHITTARFETQENTNYLLNASILATKRHPALPASFLWGDSKTLTIAKWLD
ncbi:polymer-forming cytoskeletal protein [Chryseolinea soli]|uniref:Uncharacterized protein n=1 Tax=Chryseolinea soli TaxID=2321403 RepID=A0A385SD92_9BACT|nr:hypothetical protein [Chryseolinea soli]AYB29189.1 hypothetical protein D4L85_00700 [Chryseolinea soli]